MKIHSKTINKESLKNIGDCLSKLTQAHYYWICNSIVRATWLNNIDIKKTSIKNWFCFSCDEEVPRFNSFDFEKLLLKDTIFKSNDKLNNFSVGDFLREGWRTSLKVSLIIQVQSNIEFHLQNNAKNETLDILNKEHFAFFKEARDIILHSNGYLNKRRSAGRNINIENLISFHTSSGYQLKISESKLHSASLLIIEDLYKKYTELGGEVDAITDSLINVIKIKSLKAN